MPRRKSRSDNRTSPQPYPRIEDRSDPHFGCLDDSTLVPHDRQLMREQVKAIIARAIVDAGRKSSKEILSIDPEDSEATVHKKTQKAGRGLLDYLRKYSADPAATAYQMQGMHYSQVGRDLFRRRTLQKERMNAGWRYQYLAIYCARETRRFISISDIGAREADFSAIIAFNSGVYEHLNLYVSVKNRRNTIGGQDFPKAVRALESVASGDKNRRGPYLCVFGIAMDRGTRTIRHDQEGRAHSENTEVWLSDYFWPFFTTHSYEDIMALVLEVLQQQAAEAGEFATEVDAPLELLEAFGTACRNVQLLDEDGRFADAREIVRFICS